MTTTNKAKKKLASALVPIFSLGGGAEMYLGSNKGYEVEEYKGVPVTHERYKCGTAEGILGCYFYAGPDKGTINIERYINQNQYEHIIEHEFAHYVWWEKMTDEEKGRWVRVTDESFMYPLLERYNYALKPQYVSWYASTNNREDFAESFAEDNEIQRNYAGVKQAVAKYYVRKYTVPVE